LISQKCLYYHPQIIKNDHEIAQVGVISSKPRQRVLKKYEVEKREPVQRNQMSYNSTRIKTDMSDEFLRRRQDFESFKHENKISDNSQNRRVGYFTSSGNQKEDECVIRSRVYQPDDQNVIVQELLRSYQDQINQKTSDRDQQLRMLIRQELDNSHAKSAQYNRPKRSMSEASHRISTKSCCDRNEHRVDYRKK